MGPLERAVKDPAKRSGRVERNGAQGVLLHQT